MAFWLVKLPLTIPALTLVTLVIALALIFFRKLEPLKVQPIIDRSDLISIIVATLGVIMLVWFTFQSNSKTADLLRVSTTSSDDVSHLSITLSDYENKGYIYGPADEVIEDIKYSNMISYPQGWHLTNATILDSILISKNDYRAPVELAFFYTIRLMWYWLVVNLFCRATFFIYELLRKQKPTLEVLIIGLFGGLLFQLIVGGYLLKAGFSSFLAQLLFSITFVFLTLHYLQLKKRTIEQTSSLLVTGSLLVSGMTLSWILAFPIGALTLVLTLLSPVNGKPIKLSTFFRKDLILTYGICGAIAFLSALVVVIQIVYPTNENLINMAGSIVPVNPLLLFSLLALVLSFGLKDKVIIFNSLICLFVPCFVIIGGLYSYQFLTIGTVSYYPVKLTFILFVLLMIFALYYLMVGATKLTSTHGPFVALLATAGIGMFVLCVPLTSLPQSHYMTGERLLTTERASGLAQIMKPELEKGSMVILLGQENYVEDFIATHLMYTLTRKPEDACSNEVLLRLNNQDYSGLIDNIRDCAQDGNKYAIVTSGKSTQAIHDQLSIPNVTIYD